MRNGTFARKLRGQFRTRRLEELLIRFCCFPWFCGRSDCVKKKLRYLLSQNCIPPLCELLVCADVRIIVVALEALENFLKVGVFVCLGKRRSSLKTISCVGWPAGRSKVWNKSRGRFHRRRRGIGQVGGAASSSQSRSLRQGESRKMVRFVCFNIFSCFFQVVKILEMYFAASEEESLTGLAPAPGTAFQNAPPGSGAPGNNPPPPGGYSF